eukprot:TRINITY_DN98069_c0_g1_i1.p1 TRINITY_DN98069_c0_g1~~TRINITY_DN98069_c0_g1_i1.p1  ORF type:complete len:424 (+),score=34.59 TRINITY_DN98069_c0_g1_i1:39-1310(+)
MTKACCTVFVVAALIASLALNVFLLSPIRASGLFSIDTKADARNKSHEDHVNRQGDATIGAGSMKNASLAQHFGGPVRSCVILEQQFGRGMGLCNQLMCLVGDAMEAPRDGRIWVLPNFVQAPLGVSLNTVTTRFEDLFDINVFSKHLAVINVSVATQASFRKDRLSLCTIYHEQGFLGRGWLRFLSYSRHRQQQKIRPNLMNQAEALVYRGLRLTSKLQARVDDFISHLGMGFGCLHARIERDMKEFAQLNSTLPTLRSILNGMQKVYQINRTKTVFVAVGKDISSSDDSLLSQKTAWGATLIRKGSCDLSYIECSLIDLTICRKAEWLVGHSGSTFSRTLAKYRILDQRSNPGWYNACASGFTYHEDGGYFRNLCQGQKKLKRGGHWRPFPRMFSTPACEGTIPHHTADYSSAYVQIIQKS